MPICPKCHKFISERHYERHLKRCGTEQAHETRSLDDRSVTAQLESRERGVDHGPAEPTEGRRDWKKVALAIFVISLLIGSVVVFFVLYALSLL